MEENEKNIPVNEKDASGAAPTEKDEAKAGECAAAAGESESESCTADKKQRNGKCRKELEKEREAHAAEVKDMQAKIDALNDKFLRVVAEYDNFRRRSQREKDGIHNDTKAEVLSKLLPVIDNFERAAASGDDYEGYRKGVEMVVKQLMDIVKSLGVESFGEKGDDFDATIHNAVMHAEDADAPENSVSEVFQKGYKIGDRVLRCATVKVVN